MNALELEVFEAQRGELDAARNAAANWQHQYETVRDQTAEQCAHLAERSNTAEYAAKWIREVFRLRTSDAEARRRVLDVAKDWRAISEVTFAEKLRVAVDVLMEIER